jgi:hypothetical protein
MDPVSVGTLAAAALGMGGEAIVKGAVGEVVKDAYKALKNKVAAWASNDVEALANAPASAGRRAVVAEAIDAQSAEQQAEARALAQRLIAALKEASGPIGMDIGQLDALAVKLGSITVTEGVGVRIGAAKVAGAFETDPIMVGGPSPKK